MMRQYLIALIALFFSLTSFALNNDVKANDFGRIVLTSYLDGDKCNIPHSSFNLLKNKMNQIVTQNGIGGSISQRFIITANVDVLSKEITSTAPPMHAYTLSVVFYTGDGVDGTLFSTSEVTAKGVGETEEKAYIAALKSIRTSSPLFKEMIEIGKGRIIEYYNANGDLIISKARALASIEKYDEAIFHLMTIPEVCKDVYERALNEADLVFRSKINSDGAKKLVKARAIWDAGLDYDAAVSASEVLGEIHPNSEAYAEAVVLSKEIAKRVKEIDSREWQFILKEQDFKFQVLENEHQERMIHMDNQHQERTSQIEYGHQERMSEIEAYRQIGVEQARHQPQTVYHIEWW